MQMKENMGKMKLNNLQLQSKIKCNYHNLTLEPI